MPSKLALERSFVFDTSAHLPFPTAVTWRYLLAAIDSGTNPAGKSFTHQFDTPGKYQYVCLQHRDFMNGSIEVELATRILVPKADGSTDVKFLASGRLRCTPTAATNLRNALDAALKMLEQPQQSPAAASKLN